MLRIDFLEKEKLTLTGETKKLISNYQKDPSMKNYLKLRDEVIKNYNVFFDRKEPKLVELIVEMYIPYQNRINSSMLKFTDSRHLEWKITD